MSRLAEVAFVILCAIHLSAAQERTKALEDELTKNPDDVKTLLTLGTIYYYEAAAGKEEALEKGLACFERCVALDSLNAVARVYRGSLWAIQGRDDGSMQKVEDGIFEMDEAVRIDPKNITSRLVRGINCIYLDSPFNRLGTAYEDFEYLIGCPELPYLSPEFQSTIYCWAGIAYSTGAKHEKARELLKKAITVAPGSDDAKRAERELKELN